MRVNPAQLFGLLVSWPVRSQLAARRNALIASTALAERRRELAEVEEFLERHAATRGTDRSTLEVPVRRRA